MTRQAASCPNTPVTMVLVEEVVTGMPFVMPPEPASLPSPHFFLFHKLCRPAAESSVDEEERKEEGGRGEKK